MALTAVRRETAEGRWEMVPAAPHVALRPHVRRYVGFAEHTVPGKDVRIHRIDEGPIEVEYQRAHSIRI